VKGKISERIQLRPASRSHAESQQTAIPEKLTKLAKREADVYRVAFYKEKELTDRALKLAEVGKPKSNWELQGVLGLAVFVLGFLAGK